LILHQEDCHPVVYLGSELVWLSDDHRARLQPLASCSVLSIRVPKAGRREEIRVTAALTAKYNAMCRAIDAAYKVDEVKEIRNQAIAWEVYAKQAKNTEAERRACEIRLRAERKAGKLSAKIDKSKGGRPAKKLAPLRGEFQKSNN
jgi:hypothetical protein